MVHSMGRRQWRTILLGLVFGLLVVAMGAIPALAAGTLFTASYPDEVTTPRNCPPGFPVGAGHAQPPWRLTRHKDCGQGALSSPSDTAFWIYEVSMNFEMSKPLTLSFLSDRMLMLSANCLASGSGTLGTTALAKKS